MAFVSRKSSPKQYEDIESLFRDLTSRTIPNLYSHQADLLRNYEEGAITEKDVALELPTGSGKTLVGMLIGEYRRVHFRERVVFLCPTVQLVHQVVDHANEKYGINAVGFTGSKHQFKAADKAQYRDAECIAVTTYSALFNVKPFFEDANTIILDDAHASENYISSSWSVEINRHKHSDIYQDLIEIMKPYLNDRIWERLNVETPDPVMERNFIEILPFQVFQKIFSSMTSRMQELDGDNHRGLYFPWMAIKENLAACNLYFSWDQILIRPIIPPSLANTAFKQANHRIYMSATLGKGGDLERITGVKNVTRIETPKGWDKQGLGRRFFIFPNHSFEPNDIDRLMNDFLRKTSKAVMIVGSDKQADDWKTYISEEIPEKEIFSAKDIEKSKGTYLDSKNGVVILSNRFDGIDFQDEEARLLILSHIPNHANLQERFIQSRTSAAIIFNDRNKTRLIQAIGRCTRNSNDYAAVVILGEKGVTDWFSLNEKRELLHPELQAEINFGIEQSRKTDIPNLLENFELFMDQSKDWKVAEKAILEDRDNLVQKNVRGEEQLSESVQSEVDYLYSMWEEDYKKAFENGVKTFEALSGGNELSGYRAFWAYLTANAAWLEYKQSGNTIYKKKSDQFNEKMLSIAPSLNLLRAVHNDSQTDEVNDEWTTELGQNIENLDYTLEEMGVSKSGKYKKALGDLKEALKDDQRFEESQTGIGKIIGFNSFKSKKSGAPDPYWKSGDSFIIVFEDKIYKSSDTCLSLKHVRQANSHQKWIQENESVSEATKIYTVVVTNSSCVQDDARVHCENLFYWHIVDFRKFAAKAIQFAEGIQHKYVGVGDMMFREELRDNLERFELKPSDILKQIKPMSALFK